jgi:uncharacterized protein YegL
MGSLISKEDEEHQACQHSETPTDAASADVAQDLSAQHAQDLPVQQAQTDSVHAVVAQHSPQQQQAQVDVGTMQPLLAFVPAIPEQTVSNQAMLPVTTLPRLQTVPTLPSQTSNVDAFRPRSYSRRNSGMIFELPVVPESFADDDDIPFAPLVAAAQPEPDPIVSADAVLSVSTRVEYSAMPRGQTQDVFGLVTLQAVETPKPEASSAGTTSLPERQPMDLICVLDVSGSMQGDKIRQVQDAMRFVISQADKKDRLSMVAFNSSAGRVLHLCKMDAEGKDRANVATVKLAAGGGTSIAAGLSMALSVMEQRRQQNKVSAVMLLTDGQDGSTRSQLPSLVARASQIGCSLYSFGFGADHDAALLSELAEQAQTPFTFVEDTECIRQAFAGAVGGIASIVAKGVDLTLSCRVPLKQIHTPFAVNRRSDTESVVTIPDLFAGERRDILVELAAPTAITGDRMVLLETHVRYTDLRSGLAVQTPPVTMETKMVEEPQPEDEPDAEVSAQRERVEVTRALQEATMQSDRGQFEEAQRTLEFASNRTRAKTHLSEALSQEITEARSRMSSRYTWEGGGRADVSDSTKMHMMQRSTNLNVSSKSIFGSSRKSKTLYVNRSQSDWIDRSCEF